MSQSTICDGETVVPHPGAVLDVLADFTAAAATRDHRTAVEHNGVAISYRQLAEQIQMATRCFRERIPATDVPADRMGALVAHTPAAVVHLFGILQAGGTYCPIDAALPVARQDALAAVLGLDRVFATAPDQHDLMTVPTETIDGYPVTADGRWGPPNYHCTDPAYVLCTSGSTGTPKPVVVSRHALAVTVRALRDLFSLTPDDRVLQFASLGWDTCFEEILPALTSGATLVFDCEAHSGSLPRFVRMLERQQITVLDLPTAYWHELVLFLHEERVTLPDSVRLVVIGGERVDPTRLRQWCDLKVSHVRLLNTYGCTETTMITHAVTLAGPGAETAVGACAAGVPIGRRLPHVVEHITADGELLVSGPSLASEYLGLPAITADGFPVADHGTGESRWFRTGDLVERGEDGLLYSRGRADEQVKVLGVRVHPAEVETQLNAHPAVAGAVVVGERRLGRTSLTAYVVPALDTSAAELKGHLRERLPSQFVPSRIEFVKALAYTASGKVDRAATRRAAAEHESKGTES
jgi:amino acid adenylation domain-containing protein